MLCCFRNIIYYIAIFIGIVIVFFRFWIKTLAKPCKSYTCMVGKTVIITGANTGIGFYTALDLAKRGASVILACRNEAKAILARDTIIKKYGNANITIKLINFRSFKSIRAFCKDVNETVDKIDVLINNAGAAGLRSDKTEDGHDSMWQTNYFAPFLLTMLLINKMKQSAPCRVVNVASMAANYSDVRLNSINTHDVKLIYNWTKQCNILFTRELARRLKESSNHGNISVYALHPGAIHTEIWRHLPKWFLKIWVPIMKFMYKSSEEGAQTSIYCSVAKECENDSGRLYEECGEIPMYKSCQDMTLAKTLWKKTSDLVKLEPDQRF